MGDSSFFANHPILTFLVVATVIMTGLVGLASFSTQGLLFDSISCEYQPVTAGNQTYASVSEFRSAVDRHGGNWTAIESKVTFRVQDNRLEYRLKPAECEELQQVNG